MVGFARPLGRYYPPLTNPCSSYLCHPGITLHTWPADRPCIWDMIRKVKTWIKSWYLNAWTGRDHSTFPVYLQNCATLTLASWNGFCTWTQTHTGQYLCFSLHGCCSTSMTKQEPGVKSFSPQLFERQQKISSSKRKYKNSFHEWLQALVAGSESVMQMTVNLAWHDRERGKMSQCSWWPGRIHEGSSQNGWWGN